MGLLLKFLAVGFIFFLATGTLIITDSKNRTKSKRMRITIGIMVLCIILVFFILR